MARIRLGKAERQLRREQWGLYKTLKAQAIAANSANIKNLPTSRGYTLSPDMRLGYAFHEPSNLPRPSNVGSDSWTAQQKGKKHA